MNFHSFADMGRCKMLDFAMYYVCAFACLVLCLLQLKLFSFKKNFGFGGNYRFDYMFTVFVLLRQ